MFKKIFGDHREQEVKLSVSTDTFVRFWLVIVGFLVIAGLIWVAYPAIILIAAAFFFALVLNRPVSFFARHLPGKSRTFAILIAYLLVAATVSLLFVAIIPVFTRQLASFISHLPDIFHQMKSNMGWLNDILVHYNMVNQFNKWTIDIQSQLGGGVNELGKTAIASISSLFGIIGNLIIVLFLTFFILLEGPFWEKKLWKLAYHDNDKRRRHKIIIRRMYNVISGYVTGQVIVGIISATFTAIVVGILALIFKFDINLIWPAWITIFLMVFVPMFGAVIGGSVVSILLLIYSWPAALIYLIIFIIEQQIENNIIQPSIQSKNMEISPLLILISITLGLQVGGLLGALVAIPLAGCIVVLIREALPNSDNQKHLSSNLSINNKEEIDQSLESDKPIIFTKTERRYASINANKNTKDK